MKKNKALRHAVIITICIVAVLIMMMPTAFAADLTSGTLLKIGSTGDSVSSLQNRLHNLGYLDYKGSTGYYGALTKTAVVRFQNNHGLAADGIAGAATQAKLYSSFAKSLILNIGNRGEAVTTLQAKLKELGFYTYGSITGYYGSITKSAVLGFQKAYGLAADGIAGPVTRNKLFSGTVSPTAAMPNTSASKIAYIAAAQVGKPYVLGGSGPSSYDCSGLAYYALNNAGYSVSRLSAAAYSEYSAWTKITGTALLSKGDLIFFRSDSSSYISHMGIYIGNGQFVHASSGQAKVMISDLGNVYWARNYVFARHVG
ncbi:MAG: peptidoglycan-binding protein [Christensenellales bacterium]|jgi:peptidoglycan hydrolase-like protein with peptidoglycan-binding domain